MGNGTREQCQMMETVCSCGVAVCKIEYSSHILQTVYVKYKLSPYLCLFFFFPSKAKDCEGKYLNTGYCIPF